MKQCQNLRERRKTLSSDKIKIVVFGVGGHAKVVIDVLERHGIYQIAFLVDDDPMLWGESFYGYKVINGREGLINNNERPLVGIVTIGDNASRIKWRSGLSGMVLCLVALSTNGCYCMGCTDISRNGNICLVL